MKTTTNGAQLNTAQLRTLKALAKAGTKGRYTSNRTKNQTVSGCCAAALERRGLAKLRGPYAVRGVFDYRRATITSAGLRALKGGAK